MIVALCERRHKLEERNLILFSGNEAACGNLADGDAKKIFALLFSFTGSRVPDRGPPES